VPIGRSSTPLCPWHRSGPTPIPLNRVYHDLLALLPLAPRHYQNLHHRGLSDHEIRRRPYRTLPAQGRAELADRLIDAFGPEVCAQVPGFHVKQAEGRGWWSLAGAAGLLIPVCDLQRRLIGLIVRNDEPETDLRYSSISSKKHGGAGPGAHIHVPLYESASTDSIRLTEGILKADVATALSGILTLGLPGVSAWRQALPLLREIQPRTVVLAFDADAWRNWNVARALQRTLAPSERPGYRPCSSAGAKRMGRALMICWALGSALRRSSGKPYPRPFGRLCARHTCRIPYCNSNATLPCNGATYSSSTCRRSIPGSGHGQLCRELP